MLNQRQLPYLLLLPSVLFLLAFFIWPLIEAALIALQDASGEWSPENFREMAGDLNFRDALKNTLLLVIVIVPLQLMIALGLAMLLRQLATGRDIYLYIWTIPLGVSDLAAGIVWLSLLSERGYLNTVLYYLGVIDDPALWLSYETPVALFAAVVLAEIWRATALILVIVVAGMQLIPREYGEAAEIFGATAWKRFTRVTLPMLKPSVQTALILRTILAFEVFAVVVALGGRDLPVLVGEAYFWQYDYQNTGVASAYAVLILLVSVVATLFYLRLLKVRPEQMA